MMRAGAGAVRGGTLHVSGDLATPAPSGAYSVGEQDKAGSYLRAYVLCAQEASHKL